MDDVLFRQKVSDRFYGWDATLGIKRELLTSTKDRKAKSAADITIRYSHPLGWRSQWNERLIANSPVDNDFAKAYDLTIYSDYTYEMTNRIDFALNHLITIKRENGVSTTSHTDFNVFFTNSLRISFVFYIENSVNLVTNMQLNKTNETAITTNFVFALNYRVF
jgi:hypothetical protein